ncbi:hypothetical protein [Catenulispora subtropica]|uniref:Uncharacterized protein n=1 Tax=Catenulispora subtropica TaxID=450798 RepID=A0ABN2RUK9_9ACTN
MAMGLVAAAWAFPTLMHVLHGDALSPLVLLAGTASLLRVGRTLVDRLVIAGALLGGLLIAAGMLFSFWPWHLHPVAVAGFGNTVLVVAGGIVYLRTGRTPRIPGRLRGTDAIILAGPVIAWYLLRRPVRGKRFVDALPYLMPRHDTANHYSLFDAIHRIGGYPMLHPKQASPYLLGMTRYPPGSHYLYTLLDVFRRSSTAPGTSTAEVVRYTQYEALGFCVLTLAIPWAARWVAGPSVTGWRRVLVTATASAVAVFGQLSALFWQSFDAEILGLAFLAVTLAVLFRPPAGVSEQILLSGVLLTAIAYVYTLFLVNAGIAAVVAFRMRPALRTPGGPRDLLIRVGAPALALSAVPVAGSLVDHPVTGLFTEFGGFVSLPRGSSIVLVLVAVAAVLTRPGRRSPVWRASAVSAGASFAIAVAAELDGRIRAGAPQYYSSKLVDAAWVVALCGIGALGLFLVGGPVPRRTEAVLAAVSIALPLALTNGFPMSAHGERSAYEPQGTSMMVVWSRGHIGPSWKADHATAYARAGGVFGDGVPTVFAFGTARQSWLLTMAGIAIDHASGLIDLAPLDPADFLHPVLAPGVSRVDLPLHLLNRLPADAADRPLPQDARTALDTVEAWLRTCPPGIRIAVADRAFATLLEQFAAREPERRLSVLYVPGVSYI